MPSPATSEHTTTSQPWSSEHTTVSCVPTVRNQTLNMHMQTYIQTKWTETLQRIQSHPSELQTPDSNGWYPLHGLCSSQSAPLHLIQTALELYPETASLKLPDGRLPLHVAVSNQYPRKDVIQLLLNTYHNAIQHTDNDQRTALISHLLECPSPTLEITQVLLEAYPNSVQQVDYYQAYPLHRAALRGKWEICEVILQYYPEALLEKDRSGKTPSEIAESFHRREVGERLRVEEEKVNRRLELSLCVRLGKGDNNNGRVAVLKNDDHDKEGDIDVVVNEQDTELTYSKEKNEKLISVEALSHDLAQSHVWI